MFRVVESSEINSANSVLQTGDKLDAWNSFEGHLSQMALRWKTFDSDESVANSGKSVERCKDEMFLDAISLDN